MMKPASQFTCIHTEDKKTSPGGLHGQLKESRCGVYRHIVHGVIFLVRPPLSCPRQGGNGQTADPRRQDEGGSGQGTKLRLIPLSPTYFVPEDDSEIQVEFVLDWEGKEFEAIGHFRDGGKQRLSRIKEKK